MTGITLIFAAMMAPRIAVATHDRDHVDLRSNDGTTDSSSHLLSRLDTKADMAIVVTNNDKSLEASALTGCGLLLHGHDLHHLVLEGRKEKVDDLELLNWHGEVVDVVNVANLAILDKTAELGA